MSSDSDVGMDLGEMDTQARNKARRGRAALREKRRAHELNKAFGELQGCLPFIPLRSRVSKRTVIELAIEYIRQMQDQLLSQEETGRGKQEESAGSSVVDALCQSDDAGSGKHIQTVTGAASACESTVTLHHRPHNGYCLQQYDALMSDTCQVCGCFTDAMHCYGRDQTTFAPSSPKL